MSSLTTPTLRVHDEHTATRLREEALTPHRSIGTASLMDAKEVAALLGVRAKRVYELGIPHIRVSPRTLRWKRDDVLAWIERRRSAA